METDVEFILEELDGLSETPLMHLSYVIQTLLPIRLVGWESVKRHYESLSSHTQDLSAQSSIDTYIVTGSNAEGYAIPYSLTRTEPPIVERTSDVDMLWVPQYLNISTSKLPQPNDTAFKGYLEYDGLQPGYARICLPTVKEQDESFLYNEDTGMFYLSSTIMMEKVQSIIPNFCLEKSERAWVQGPAFTVEDDQLLTRDNLYEPNVGASRDFVTAIDCSPWPEIASSWKGRASKSSWLDPQLVDSIIADGCHVVAVPSKNSPRPELEWRISFSASEGRIAREAVTDYQRQCYIYVKILRKQVMGNVSVLSSYVFKSVFLYCCMNLPIDHWKKYPGNCVLYILDVLLECLGKKHVPTFFLPENNLIGHMSDSEIDVALATVVSMRCDPVTPILDYMDTRVLGYQSVIATFREVLKPLLEDMKMFKVHRDKNISVMKGIIATGYNICHYLLHEIPSEQEARIAKHKEAIYCLIDIYTLWLVPMKLDATLMQFINSAGLMIQDLSIASRFFEAVVSLSTDYPEFASARGNLACMYHSLAYSEPQGSVLRAEYLNKAGHTFKEVYEENKSSTIDYVTYLVKLNKYTSAKNILEEFIEHLDSHTPTEIAYSEKEKDTLEDPLRHHVEANGKLEADDISFAYFYLVKCHSSLNSSGKQTGSIQSVIEKFEKHCETMKTSQTKVLLGYAQTMLEGMENSIKVTDSDWDTESGLSTLHLSYIVQLLLPARHIGWKTENKFHKPFTIPVIEGIDHICIPTGSTAEGLNIPKCMVNNSSVFEVFSDTDLLCVPNDLKISTNEFDETKSDFSGHFVSRGVVPGYTKICFKDVKTPYKDILSIDSVSGKHYLDRTKFMKGAYAKAKLDLESTKDTSIQGPALSVTEMELVEFNGKFDPHAGVSRDFVLALPCDPWPPIADKWKDRVKDSTWLQPSMVESILRDGCHVVGTPSKNSTNPDLEWRISFSASEGRLAREAVTDYQRQCYIYLKILRHQVMKPEPILSSYVFKSVFFYSCEILPVHLWNEKPGNCILYMVDLLLECLRKKHVPTYFVPENNLINHLTDKELDEAVSKVKLLRKDPISPVLQFTDQRSFSFHSIIVPFRSMISPLLDDMKEFTLHRGRNKAINDGFLLSAITICQFYLMEHMDDQFKDFELKKHQEGIRTLIHFYNQWLKPSLMSVPPMLSFIASLGFEMDDHAQSRDFYEAAIGLGEEYPEFLELRVNLASLYHSSAYSKECNDTSERDTYLEKASDLFEELYKEGVPCVIDYVTYLVKENQFVRGKLVLEEFLENANDSSNIVYSYTPKEIDIIDVNLRKYVQDNGVVYGDAISFAYYYLVECILALPVHSQDEISTALQKLKVHCENIKTECTFDFYSEAMKMSVANETAVKNHFVSPAATFMLMAVGIPCVFSLVISAVKHL